MHNFFSSFPFKREINKFIRDIVNNMKTDFNDINRSPCGDSCHKSAEAFSINCHDIFII